MVLIVYLFLQSFRTTIICTVAIFVVADHDVRGHARAGLLDQPASRCSAWCWRSAWSSTTRSSSSRTSSATCTSTTSRRRRRRSRSMGEIASSLVAVVLVMASVFVPAAFLPGTTGQLYKQFAITIVVSVAISGFVALTLTPAMCALMLKHNPPPTARASSRWFNRQVDRDHARLRRTRSSSSIKRIADRARPARRASCGSIYHLFTVLPTSFVPERGPGLRDGGDHHAGGGEHRPHAGGRRKGRCDLREALPGVETALDDHRLQPAR